MVKELQDKHLEAIELPFKDEHPDLITISKEINTNLAKESTKLSIQFTIDVLKELSMNPHFGNFEDMIINQKIEELEQEIKNI